MNAQDRHIRRAMLATEIKDRQYEIARLNIEEAMEVKATLKRGDNSLSYFLLQTTDKNATVKTYTHILSVSNTLANALILTKHETMGWYIGQDTIEAIHLTTEKLGTPITKAEFVKVLQQLACFVAETHKHVLGLLSVAVRP